MWSGCGKLTNIFLRSGTERTRMKKTELFPKYAWIPVLAVIAANLIVYYITGFAVNDQQRHYINMKIDGAIPFVPFFVVFYVLAFVQWAAGWFFTAREGKAFCYRFCKADVIAKILCLVVFIAYPTIMERPHLEVNGVFTWVLNIIYSVDKPVNCLPSIHVLASWIAMRSALKMERVGNTYRMIITLETVLCACAVVLIKQHYFIDIPTGILAAEIGLAVSKRLDNERFLWVR